LNWGYLLVRAAVALTILAMLFLSQRFWYRNIWKVTANWGTLWLRIAVRLLYILAFCLILVAITDNLRIDRGRILPRGNLVTVLSGLWFMSALFGYIAVKGVGLLETAWHFLRRSGTRSAKRGQPAIAAPVHAGAHMYPDSLPDPSRRYFFRTATMAAGAAPFIGVMYGYAAERLNYQIREVPLFIPNLPAGLRGLKVAQLSDIHMSGYMPRSQVRRAVEMANELNADIAFVTGDFITGLHDPLAECVAEIRRLNAPLGVWGCNGNHEIYARAEDEAERLFTRAGMKLLRGENTLIQFNGASFNLIGVDYQRERTPSGRRVQLLRGIEPLVRRDMPNILLSHNPNTFNRAAEVGIELSLAGHTHGGQIQVEILDHRLSPARFITDYIAGTYHRPLFAPAITDRAWHDPAKTHSPSQTKGAPSLGEVLAPGTKLSVLYVNRGLGTVGAPVRIGVPPEITLLTLHPAAEA
jgi:uncharacterized protein